MIFHRGGIFLSIDSTQSSTWSNLAQFPISAVHNSLYMFSFVPFSSGFARENVFYFIPGLEQNTKKNH